MSNGTSEDDLVGIFHGEAVVGVVEYDFDKGVDGCGAGSFVEEGLAFFLWGVVVSCGELLRNVSIYYNIIDERLGQVVGYQPERSTGGGTSDGRFLAPRGMEVVELGPVNATIHKIDERVLAADLPRLRDVYEALGERLLPRLSS